MYRANEVREFTTRLSVLAVRSKAAVIVVSHLNKGVGRKGIYRASGSIDFVASARTVILAGKGQPEDIERAITVVKSNYAETDVTTGYSIVDGIFRWTGETDLKADDLLSEPSRTDGAPARTEAEEFLREALVRGSLESATLEELARQRGITSATLRRAKKELGVLAIRVGTGGAGGNGKWFSRLPEAVQDARDDVVEHVARLENVSEDPPALIEHLADEHVHFDIGEDVTGSDTGLTE
jgi:hypothetical protein